jgi:hypothetical protein
VPPVGPMLTDRPSKFLSLERAVEDEYRPRMLEELQRRVNELAETTRATIPVCAHCGRSTVCQDVRPVSGWARFGRLRVGVPRYRCPDCGSESRPLLDLPGVEPGRISGSLARLPALLAAVAPYQLAARLAWLLPGVTISPMGVWRVAQRLGQAAASYSETLSRDHTDSRSEGAPTHEAPARYYSVWMTAPSVMQVRARRRRQTGTDPLPPLPTVEEGHFREVKTGVLLLPEERVETPRDATPWCGVFW